MDPRDRNQDGIVSPLEQADTNLDGVVSIIDLSNVAQFFNQKVPGNSPSVSPSRSPSRSPSASASPSPSQPPPASPGVELAIATRGKNLMPHEIRVPDPMSWYSWGQHATESSGQKPADSGWVNVWDVFMPDASQVGGVGPVRINVLEMGLLLYKPSTRAWIWLYRGMPTWEVNADLSTAGGYVDIHPTFEADGSQSWVLPPNHTVHMAGNGANIAEGQGVLGYVKARLLGTPAAVAAAKVGCAAGSDYRATNGVFNQGMSTPGYHEAGFGRFRRLTGDWATSYMLSSVMTDNQVRASGLVLPS